ncbi:penicillin-binding protein activator LpoB [Pollutimonas sp. M17]|uniref:penicillin-binding protein activator LpoB n=1 Tax=Pollutimonas sp. M17 TaxID=2962065 RepID=UPI0021F3EEBE|nr:penicillin-binding protein activator LpoB [Pollutimonas sp. M17]UYO93381.1 penicillin-binding protein activator LpoB [Pollutimonas sp. M17]HWK71825.1 penicillin-binding protein activator LpoB [Burkholderiaceae bacterium]
MNTKLLLSSLAVTLALTGCATTTHYVDQKNDTVAVMGLDYKDFESAASEMVNQMLASPLMVHPKASQGGRYVMAVSNIVNDTTQRIDTDQLTKKIRISLLNSGRFIVTTAIGINGAEDDMTRKSRQLRNSKMVNQKTVKKDGRVIAPDYSLSGKIIQRVNRVNSRTQQVDYYFQLTMTNLDDGLAYWEGEYPIVKRGDNRTVTW